MEKFNPGKYDNWLFPKWSAAADAAEKAAAQIRAQARADAKEVRRAAQAERLALGIEQAPKPAKPKIHEIRGRVKNLRVEAMSRRK